MVLSSHRFIKVKADEYLGDSGVSMAVKCDNRLEPIHALKVKTADLTGEETRSKDPGIRELIVVNIY